MTDVLTAIPFSFLLAIATGPVFFILLETSISKGSRAAFMVDVGAVFADVVFIAIAFLGTKSLLVDIKDNPNLYVLGGVLLVTYSTITATATYRKRDEIIKEEMVAPRGLYLLAYFLKGFFLNIINFGTFLFWLGLFVYFAPSFDLDAKRILVFFSSILIGYLVIGVVKIILAKQLSDKLTPRIIYKLRMSVCVLLTAFGLYFIYQGVFAVDADTLIETIEDWG